MFDLGDICTFKEVISLIEIILHTQNNQNNEKRKKTQSSSDMHYWLTESIDGTSIRSVIGNLESIQLTYLFRPQCSRRRTCEMSCRLIAEP